MLITGCATSRTPPGGELHCGLTHVRSARGPFPRYGATAATDGRQVYVAAGGGVGGRYAHVDRFDPASGSWSVLAVDLVPRRYTAAAIFRRKLYVIGGSDSEKRDSDVVEAVDLDSGVVERMPPLPSPRRWASAVLFRNRIWVIGGASGEGRLSRVDIFDPRSHTWSRGPDLGVARQARAVVARGTIWVLGGYRGPNLPISTTIERLEGGRFEIAGEMPSTSAYSAQVLDDRWIYTFGDYRELGRVMRYDVDQREWVRIDPGYTARRHTASAVVGNAVIIFGGNVRSDGSSLDLAETFERRCGAPPAVDARPERSFGVVRLASELMVASLLEAETEGDIPVLERPNHFFERSRDHLPEGFEKEDRRRLISVWRTLGLLANGSKTPLGLYDPDTREIYVSRKGALPKILPHTLSHEMVHAFRHRAGDYEVVLAERASDVDRWLAGRALTEGDASLLGYFAAVAQKKGVAPDWIRRKSRAPIQVPPTMMETIREQLDRTTTYRAMPYQHGTLFALHVAQHGGLDGLRKAFANPPRSTEQILHPEKYLSPSPDEPTAVDLSDITRLSGVEGTLSSSWTIGEFDLRHALAKALDEPAAASAAAGWDGGRVGLLEAAGGTTLVMKTVWDTEQDAAEFAVAWTSAAKKRSHHLRISREGASVLVLQDL